MLTARVVAGRGAPPIAFSLKFEYIALSETQDELQGPSRGRRRGGACQPLSFCACECL